MSAQVQNETKSNKKQQPPTAVAVKESTEISTDVAPANWGNDAEIDNSERLVPKLHLLQGQSKLVAEERGKTGDIVNIVTGEVLGGKEPVEFIPIKKLTSSWVVYDRTTGERVFKEIFDVTPENAKLPYVEKDAKGVVILERDYSINFLVLLAKDTGFPIVASFKRTSVKAGKKLVNHFDRCRNDKVAPATYALSLVSQKLTNRDGKPYCVFDLLADRRKSTPAELNAAYQWFKTFQTQELKVDNSDVTDGGEASAPIETEASDGSQY